MKILIVSQYFWPESFKINDIALGLKEKGHQVSVLTGVPNYPKGEFYDGYNSKSGDEVWNGIKIYRAKLYPRKSGGVNLFLNYLSFVIFGWLKVNAIKEKFDRILVYEPSPVTVGIPAMNASKKFTAPYYFWVQDLWPESLDSAGGIKNKYIISFFDKVTKLIYKKAEKVLVQSEGFKDYILEQGVPEDKIIFYPNSTELLYVSKHASEEYLEKLPRGFNLMFAGNLGESQGLNVFIEAAAIIQKKDVNINWIFLGDGRNKPIMEKMIAEKNLNNFFLLGSFPAEEMPDFFACADALLVSLKKAPIFALTIPSKIQSYMACGKPIIASLDGEGAKVVNQSNCGYASSAEDSELLAENILRFYKLSPEDRNIMGNNALSYFNNNFEREMLLSKLENILK